ncbi:MAG: phenylalanyl-tRNA synthetase beta chain [Pyrinomonadaceae bacterium]|jgi:phenylalanyl-tRNA synthetase beta chain|nr:phenylalanyl-tRNA synthetase beta chain [Pyrinomonadaceae bacterium]
MLISYNWLRELTGTVLTPLELRERLTMVGLAIDAVDEIEGDSILDVEVPSNRPDCLSHIGIAREVSVIEKSKLQIPTSKVTKTEGRAADHAQVEIHAPDLCPRYAARIVRGVKIAPSPDWLVKRLAEIGQRAINNVADITNYVLHELGQPLHAFDLARLTDHQIVVRRARAGEKLQTLDDVERKLDPDVLVIADATRPVALAGIMGGLESEISQTTTDVLVESAYFNPDSVRGTARKLGMDTEASRRFERGADCASVLQAQTRCVELICEIAGGVATDDAIDIYPQPLEARSVEFRPARVESLTSLRVEPGEMQRILAALGFVENPSGSPTVREGSQAAGASTFVVPSWRSDVGLEEDLIEEIARHAGFDKIASELPPSNMAGEYQPVEMKRRDLRRALRSLGFDEAINFSFIDNAHDEQFALLPGLTTVSESAAERLVTLQNPILDEATRMRPTLLPGLLQAVRHNLNYGTRDISLFELGRVFATFKQGELPVEREALALVATGGALTEGRVQAEREFDFFQLKGALEAAVDAMGLGPLTFSSAAIAHLRPGQSAAIFLDDETPLGSIGRLSESLAQPYKFRQPVYLAEIDLSSLLESRGRPLQYAPLPRYPAVVRDVTLLVGRDVTFAELKQAIAAAEIADYAGVVLVGVYEGSNIPEAKRSVTFRVEYRAPERTLRDEEVEERQRNLIDLLLRKFAAELH